MSTETRAILKDDAHRPWPLPDGPWVMFQSWRNLLFAHWPVPREVLRPLVPESLTLDEHDGSAWVGLTPFRLVGLRARLLPAIPVGSNFPEMNLRTYVRHDGRPGIFFFTLEAASRLAVIGARTLYRLPYHHARMRIVTEDGWIGYRSRRGDGSAAFRGRYRPDGPVFEAEAGSLEHFLIERYALYSVLPEGSLLTADIHHRPWQVQPADADIELNTVPEACGFSLPARDPLLHFSARQDTLVWRPKLVG